MIRPFTCLCLLLAAGSGLYLYQEKHQAQLADQEIARIIKATDAVRARTGVLRAEYALLNDPERLAGLAQAHLVSLRSTDPKQFATLAELDRRLPPVGPPPSAAPDPAEAAPLPPSEAVPLAAATPKPPHPAAVKLAMTVAAPALPAAAMSASGAPTGNTAVKVASLAAQAKPAAPKPAKSVVLARKDPFATPVSAPASFGPALARPVMATPMVASPVMSGSALGMARLSTPAASVYPAVSR